MVFDLEGEETVTEPKTTPMGCGVLFKKDQKGKGFVFNQNHQGFSFLKGKGSKIEEVEGEFHSTRRILGPYSFG